MINSLYIMNLSSLERVYAQADRDRLIQASHVLRAPMDTLDVYKHKEALEQVDVIFSGWGGPTLDEQFLQATPKLKAFFLCSGIFANDRDRSGLGTRHSIFICKCRKCHPCRRIYAFTNSICSKTRMADDPTCKGISIVSG